MGFTIGDLPTLRSKKAAAEPHEADRHTERIEVLRLAEMAPKPKHDARQHAQSRRAWTHGSVSDIDQISSGRRRSVLA
jgi:hypothetical protein